VGSRTLPVAAPFIGGGACVNRRAFAFPSLPRPCYAAHMGDERVLAAIDRLERALGRIEAAAARPAPAPPPQPDEKLAAAHTALRGKVEAAIAEIDTLLATAKAP
jgi:hypothetical protein